MRKKYILLTVSDTNDYPKSGVDAVIDRLEVMPGVQADVIATQTALQICLANGLSGKERK